MAYADYLHCPGCDGKAIYWPDDEPDGVIAWHQSCLDAEIAKRIEVALARVREAAP